MNFMESDVPDALTFERKWPKCVQLSSFSVSCRVHVNLNSICCAADTVETVSLGTMTLRRHEHVETCCIMALAQHEL